MKNSDEMTAALAVPFPQMAIKYRTDRGKSMPYVESHTIIRRLIEATDNAFDVAVLEQSIQPNGKTKDGADKFLITARVRLTIPGLGSREHMGVQSISAGGGEDLAKGAISDAIKKAATLFGVGLDLYGPDYEAGEVDDRAMSQRPAPRQDAPVRPQDAPRAQMASRRQLEMASERWSALALDPSKIDGQCRKWYGVRFQDMTRDNAEDMIRRLDRKITEASPQGLTPQSPAPSGMDEDDYQEVLVGIAAEEARNADRWTR